MLVPGLPASIFTKYANFLKAITPDHLATATIQATRATERTTLSRACPATKTANAHETESCAPVTVSRCAPLWYGSKSANNLYCPMHATLRLRLILAGLLILSSP